MVAIKGRKVRGGLEDNIYLAKGTFARSNADVVQKMVRILTELDMELTSPKETRELLRLEGKKRTNY